VTLLKKVKILLADDHQILRDGLRTLLNTQNDMEVVGEAETGRQAIEMSVAHCPDVLVMDVIMPELNGIEATCRLKKEQPGVKVLALSMHADRKFVTEMLRAGASGFLLKECAFRELAEAIRAIVAGKVYLSPSISKVVVEEYLDFLNEDKECVSSGHVLSLREREVLQQIAEGKGNRDIAKSLHVSVKTVETHKYNIMRKLGLRSVAELTKYAIKSGITSID
jgi:two-component system response regulator NreC